MWFYCVSTEISGYKNHVAFQQLFAQVMHNQPTEKLNSLPPVADNGAENILSSENNLFVPYAPIHGGEHAAMSISK